MQRISWKILWFWIFLDWKSTQFWFCSFAFSFADFIQFEFDYVRLASPSKWPLSLWCFAVQWNLARMKLDFSFIRKIMRIFCAFVVAYVSMRILWENFCNAIIIFWSQNQAMKSHCGGPNWHYFVLLFQSIILKDTFFHHRYARLKANKLFIQMKKISKNKS